MSSVKLIFIWSVNDSLKWTVSDNFANEISEIIYLVNKKSDGISIYVFFFYFIFLILQIKSSNRWAIDRNLKEYES